LVVLAFAGCSSTTPAPDDPRLECPADGGTCAEGCVAVYGYSIDKTQRCRALTAEVLTCTRPHGVTGAVTCSARTADGALFVTPTNPLYAPAYAGWRPCNDEELALFDDDRLPPCEGG
jgi:hypothetical protein